MDIAEITFLNIQESPECIEIINIALDKCYETENLKGKGLYVDVILTNAKHIRELNKKYRDIDEETDVLSFPMFQKEEIEKITGTTQEVLGDIVISLEQVKKQADEYGHSFERELSYMTVHSFYHLLGYDHMKKKDKDEMRLKEEAILSAILK